MPVTLRPAKAVRTMGPLVIAIAIVLSLICFQPPQPAAAATRIPLNLIYYGVNSPTTDQRIINAHPEFIVNNSPAGPWRGNADISTFTSAGIKYFEYLDGGYEAAQSRAIPNDLPSNFAYMEAAARSGAYGVFLDEVSAYPTPAGMSYLQQFADQAHALGLKVVFNTGVDTWSDALMSYCDYMNSSEVWSNAPLTYSQQKWASRTWLLTQNVYDAGTAASLTRAAWSKGVLAEYACLAYGDLPTYLESYISQISSYLPAPVVSPPPSPNPAPGPAPVPGTGEIRSSVASGSDDGFAGTWAFAPGSSWYESGSPGTGAVYGSWFRFSGVAIPHGASIVEARLETVQGSWSSGTSLKISAEKSASPTAPSSTADYSSRPRTTAAVDWDTGYADWSWHSSPDFAAVIQELVDTYDYPAGGVIQVLVDNDGSAAGSKSTGLVYESGSAPRLFIRYG